MSWPLGWASAALLLPSWFDIQVQHSISMAEYYARVREAVPFAPPTWIFGPVWLVLYILISVAVGLWADRDVMELNNSHFHWTLAVISLNYVFNKAWQIIFFDLRMPVAAAIDALLILGTAIAAMVLFASNGGTHVAVYALWGIYIAWLTFAAVLSIAIAVRRDRLSLGRLGTSEFNINEL